jgi:hypothetical protein
VPVLPSNASMTDSGLVIRTSPGSTLEEAHRSFHLGAHAARRKLSLRHVLPSLCERHLLKGALVRLEVDADLMHAGGDQKIGAKLLANRADVRSLSITASTPL